MERKGTKGRISIEFFSEEELRGILNHIAGEMKEAARANEQVLAATSENPEMSLVEPVADENIIPTTPSFVPELDAASEEDNTPRSWFAPNVQNPNDISSHEPPTHIS